MSATQIDPVQFREVLGQFPTGVVVVTALDGHGEPVGMTVGSFTSVSLDPPLVAFLPAKTSSSWAALRAAGDSFCINVLSADQEWLCREIASRKTDKFRHIEWKPTEMGHPLIDGAVAYIDCRTDAIHDAGDHDIVVGRVQGLAVRSAALPLLFFRGGYGSFVPASLVAADVKLTQQLRDIELSRTVMEVLSAELGTEVTATVAVGQELILAAAAGHVQSATVPTRVGQRMPFVAPLGSVFAAWGDEPMIDRWVKTSLGASMHPDPEELRSSLAVVRERGVAISLGRQLSTQLADLSSSWDAVGAAVSLERVVHQLELAATFNPLILDDEAQRAVESIAAPVFAADDKVAFAITVWEPSVMVSDMSVTQLIERLKAATREAGAAIRASVGLDGGSV